MAITEQFSSVQDLGEEANNTSTEAVLHVMITQQLNRQTRKKNAQLLSFEDAHRFGT